MASFALRILGACFVVSRSAHASSIEPQHYERDRQLLFAPKRLLPNSGASGALVVLWRKNSHLAPSNWRRHTSSPFPFLYWLLLVAGDVEINPGSTKHPCAVCCKPVKRNQRGIYCDASYSWLHTRCISMSNEEYSELQHSDSDQPWCCKRCQEEALPYHNVSNSDSIFNTSNPASVLNTSAHPSTTSAPQSPSPSLTVLYTNCRNILPKLDHLRLLVTAHNPHIIAICELGSMLTSLMTNFSSQVSQ